MCFHMSCKAILAQNNLITLGACIWFLSRVGSAVADQATRLGERFMTGEASEGLFSCVCPLVTLHVTRIRKSLVTLGTGIGFLSGAYFLVPPQVF